MKVLFVLFCFSLLFCPASPYLFFGATITSTVESPKMSSQGGYFGRWPLTRSETILGQEFASLAYGNYSFNFLFAWKVKFEKNPLLPFEKFPSLVLPRKFKMLQHLIQFTLYYLSSGSLLEVKNKTKFETFSSKSGRGHLGEMFVYKRFRI